MKKGIKILCLVVALIAVFLLGWRVMPRVWPGIKESVVYPLFPQYQPTPAPTREPYHPQTNTAFDDAISASDSVIYYFYKDYCPYCRELEPLTSGLPQTITLPDGTVSAVRLIGLNKVEDVYFKIISDYYEKYNVPEEKQFVPAMVIGDRYMMPGSEIVDQLLDALVAGEGLDTPLLNGAERIP